MKNLRNFIAPLLALTVISCNPSGQTGETEQEAISGFALSNLDTTADPCTDFFQYSSGGWVENNPIPETESRWGNFNVLQESNRAKMRSLLDSLAELDEGRDEAHYARLLRLQYQAGLDSAAIEMRGLKPIKPYLKQVTDLKSKDDYRQYLAYTAAHSLPAPLSSGVTVDAADSERYRFRLSQSGIGLPDRDYYLKVDSSSVEIQRKYREHVQKTLELSGMDSDEAIAAAEAIFDFEKSLAKVMMSRVDRRDPENTYNLYARKDLMELMPDLDMEAYLTSVNVEFDSAVVNQPDYLRKMNFIVKNTSMKTLRYYHSWHLLRSHAHFLPAQFQKEHFRFYSTELRGTKKMKPRWKRVMDKLGSGLDKPLGRLFVEKHFSEEAKAAVEQMVEDMRSAYADRIDQLEWMTDSTRQKAHEKLAAFKYKIGYPDEWEELDSLQLEAGAYFENYRRVKRYRRQENIDKLGKPVDKDEWFMPAYLVNAYYSSSYNEIVFPAGILQPPFYDKDADPAINYGGIGGVIGHEFSHGFDDQGSKYDAAGNLNNWWTPTDRENFEERTDRMVAQYNAYEPLPETTVDGELTLGENIADLGGLTLAYHGFAKRLERRAKDGEKKAGFSWQQRIFLGWGQVWQTAQTDEFLKNQVMTDPHSPARYRVNGPVSNMPEFWEAWDCSPGDEMVRSDSLLVEIW